MSGYFIDLKARGGKRTGEDRRGEDRRKDIRRESDAEAEYIVILQAIDARLNDMEARVKEMQQTLSYLRIT